MKELVVFICFENKLADVNAAQDSLAPLSEAHESYLSSIRKYSVEMLEREILFANLLTKTAQYLMVVKQDQDNPKADVVEALEELEEEYHEATKNTSFLKRAGEPATQDY